MFYPSLDGCTLWSETLAAFDPGTYESPEEGRRGSSGERSRRRDHGRPTWSHETPSPTLRSFRAPEGRRSTAVFRRVPPCPTTPRPYTHPSRRERTVRKDRRAPGPTTQGGRRTGRGTREGRGRRLAREERVRAGEVTRHRRRPVDAGDPPAEGDVGVEAVQEADGQHSQDDTRHHLKTLPLPLDDPLPWERKSK